VQLSRRAQSCLSRQAERASERLELTAVRRPEPQAQFAPLAQRLDDFGERLPRALASRAGHARADLNAIAPRLRPQLLGDRIERSSERLASLWRLAELAHPDRPLQRGFARVTGRSGRTIVRAADALAERLLSLRFGDGEVPVVAGDPLSPAAASPPPVERKPKRSYVPPQPGLFDEE
jgi:exodeoxyribonuclease VII large subunit